MLFASWLKLAFYFIMIFVTKRAEEFFSIREHSAGPKLTSLSQYLRLRVENELDVKWKCSPRVSTTTDKITRPVTRSFTAGSGGILTWSLDRSTARAAPVFGGPP